LRRIDAAGIVWGVTGSLEHWRDEMGSAFLYRVLADVERGTPREALFRDLARAAEEQAAVWAESALHEGQAPPAYAPDPRTRIAAALLRRVGPRRMRHILAAMKAHPLGRDAALIGEVRKEPEARVILRTPIGSTRILDMLVGEPLPRIC